ncbi:MarR family winged helix-turn-helix transcriptional regulator, partial [Desulfofundulus sp.]|uniref:MarR family winged helix-turn-helix transcriptional regulator n=1 Tax=Desulfofundulus sp. TaxID=2282750 RepID=UPI003C778403
MQRGSMSVSEMAGEMGVSISAVTSQMDKLCRAGFVQRRRDERGDRRVVWLELTPRGKEVVGFCLAAKRQVMARYWSQLGEEDLEHLVNILEKLLVVINREGSLDA